MKFFTVYVFMWERVCACGGHMTAFGDLFSPPVWFLVIRQTQDIKLGGNTFTWWAVSLVQISTP